MRLTLVFAVTALGAAAFPAAIAGAQGRCGPQTCRADVSISGHAEPQPIRRGEVSELKLTAMNNGPDGALRIDLQAIVPDGLQILEVKHFGGRSCTTKGTFVQCDLGDFATQQQAVVRIKVKGVKTGTHITRAKVYAGDVDDPNGGNGQVSATLLVQDRPNSTAAIRLADPQRILRTGGIRLHATPAQGGRVSVRGEVRTPLGRVRLVSVTRDGTAGESLSIFLGTTPGALRKIRRGLQGNRRLRTIVWVRSGGVTARRELHVRR